VTSRADFERLLRELHAARIAGAPARLCALFAADARLRIVGTGDGKAIAITASGIEEIRNWLTMLVKTFRLSQYEHLSTIIDAERAAVHWRVQIRSRVTGQLVPTELVDMVEVRDCLIAAHTEFFVPGGPPPLVNAP
jgi:ketosteroid isomerase-like protein